MYGITVPSNKTIERIVLEFTPSYGPYFLTMPFFEPFKTLEKSPERIVVEINLMVNIELIRKLASFGADVKILEPASLAETLRTFFEKALASK